jgi:predicted component of type VI protein secretion system
VIQLSILYGERAGREFVARRFPFLIGRAPPNHLPIQADGVWDRHLEIHFRRDDGFHLKTCAGALVAVNGQPVTQTRLRNGDLLELGSLKLRFWLAPAVQHSLRPRELLTWGALGVLVLLELVLIYALLG